MRIWVENHNYVNKYIHKFAFNELAHDGDIKCVCIPYNPRKRDDETLKLRE